MERVPEILAPAGGRAQFFAALNAGADAVYLGLKSLNARARAENFTADDLAELVPLAHAHGMRVLVTLNILMKEAELPTLLRTLATLEDLEVDAAIIQDLAVAALARRHFPRLRLHASTQMAVHNAAGVLAAAEQGIRRVVVARELSAAELKRIRALVPREQVEIEAFCHGSLCYSYSGLCFFSGAEDARSGNRGECAYTCRQPYKIVSEPGHGFLFSMRDLDTSESIGLLVGAGIDALKIEGRKKDAQYVATSVRLYRERLDAHFGRPTLRPEAPRGAHVLAAAAEPASLREDHGFSYSRRPTSLFLRSRYHENVVDLDNPTHQGALVGTVERVRGRRVTLRAACALERFDGLRLRPGARVYHALPQNGTHVASDTQAMQARYDNRDHEFSLRDLWVDGHTVASAAAGALVELEIGGDVGETPRVGDALHKIRSADLKRRLEPLTAAPEGSKTRRLWPIVIEAHVEAHADDPTRATITIEARKGDDVVASVSSAIGVERARGEPRLAQDVGEAFAVLGDAECAATEVTFIGDDSLFVPRSTLKRLKADLAAQLQPALLARREARIDAAIRALGPAQREPWPQEAARPRYIVKADRLETLEAAVAFATAHPDLTLEEVIFEPKRAFLGTATPGATLDALRTLLDAAPGQPTLRLAVPTVVRAWDEPYLKRWVAEASARGIVHYEIGNVGGLRLLQGYGVDARGLDVAADFSLYALNSAATDAQEQLGVTRTCLSIEDDRTNLEAHLARLDASARARAVAIVYKDTPLFIAEACTLTALHDGCPTAAVCGYRTLEVENPKGERFYVAHETCKSVVYAKTAFSLTHRQDALARLGVTTFRLDFLTRPYTEGDVTRILGDALAQRRVDDTHTANFDRALL